MRDGLLKTLLNLETNPRPRGSKRLRGGDEYRLRVGSYRILYTVDDSGQVVEIIAVGHRRDVYRGL
ncbi:MAG: type II toxin-antitoxin system RelE/ParE family toxin [Phycisphaerae bacterium]|nr:type II toxin-antitoxin system RelE/ParE family toxin [Phycisphaerae bacterium]